jgi:hypothetical protein
LGNVPKHRDALACELTRSKVGRKVEGVDIVYSILEFSKGFSQLMRGGLRPHDGQVSDARISTSDPQGCFFLIPGLIPGFVIIDLLLMFF